MLNEQEVVRQFEQQLALIQDPALLEVIRAHQVAPHAVQGDWNYGKQKQLFPCWTVLEHQRSNTAIVYCEQGFGPTSPWGVLALSGPNLNMGMDAQWFSFFEDAVRESQLWTGENPPGYEVS